MGQIIYGFHGPKHQTNKKSLDVTPVTDGRTNGGKRKIKQYSGRPETAKIGITSLWEDREAKLLTNCSRLIKKITKANWTFLKNKKKYSGHDCVH